MKLLSSSLLATALCPMLLPGLALAQAPTIINQMPRPNATGVSRDAINLTFSQAVTGASGIRVFSSRWHGLQPGTGSGDGTTQLGYQLAPGQGFRPDELVSVTVPASVRGAGGSGAATGGSVFQFRTLMQGLYTGYFLNPVTLPEAGTTLSDPILADVNNDGQLDLLLADSQNDRVRLRLGTTSGSLLGPATLLNMGVRPASIAVADMNNDGNLDLLTSSSGTMSRSVNIALGTGQGTFGTPASVALAAIPGQVRVGDVNADGNLDFVVTVATPNSTAVVAVRLGNGLGSFTATPDVPVDLEASNLHLADFNNDGQLDMLVGSVATGLLKIYLGNGQGGFALAAAPTLVRTGRTDVADLTDDGILDVAMVDNAGNAIRIYPGTGTGGFGIATVLTVSRPLAVHLADATSDGEPDVLATYNNGPGAAGVALWRNNRNTPGVFGSGQLTPGLAGTDLVTGSIGGYPRLVVVDNGLNGASPNIKLSMNQPVLATHQPENALAATCFPNPAHGSVQVLLADAGTTSLQAELYNALGQRVRQLQHQAASASTPVTLNVLGLAPGLYTLRLTTARQTTSQQLVLE